MKHVLVAATTALLLAGSVAYAQQPPAMPQAPTVQAQPDIETGAIRREGRRGGGQMMSAEDRAAFLDARLAALKAGLKLTAAQEPLWAPFEAAVREMITERAEARTERRSERREAKQAGERPDPIERMRERAERLSDRAESLENLADAAEPLYKSLDDAQKRRLRVLMRADRRHGGGGMRMHHPMQRG
jgi:zinc resistance-associated protein